MIREGYIPDHTVDIPFFSNSELADMAHKDNIDSKNPNQKSKHPSKVLETLKKTLTTREAIGQEKYGTTLDRTDFKHEHYLQHALEEACDQAMYIQGALLRASAMRRDYDLLYQMVVELHLDLAAHMTNNIAGQPYTRGVEYALMKLNERLEEYNIQTDLRRKMVL